MGYKELNLQKNECYECEEQFITGKEISKDTGMICPYCGSHNTSWVSYTEDIEELDLGCVGLSTEVKEDEENN